MSRFSFFLLMMMLYQSFAVMVGEIELEPVDIRPTDIPAIERGADFFVAHCHSCHTAKYAVNDPISKAAGVIDRDPLVIDGHEIPDLSLKVSELGANWVYTYLQAYFVDESRPSGYNNIVKKNTSMPHVLLGLQGEHRLLADKLNDAQSPPRLYEVLYKTKSGSMSSAEFYEHLNDLMHYLAYISDPSEAQRLSIAPAVLTYLIILFVLLWFIYRGIKRRYD